MEPYQGPCEGQPVRDTLRSPPTDTMKGPLEGPLWLRNRAFWNQFCAYINVSISSSCEAGHRETVLTLEKSRTKDPLQEEMVKYSMGINGEEVC